MKFYTQSFFCGKKKGPICHISHDKDSYYPTTISISQDIAQHSTPQINFYLNSLEDLVAFKNSVICSFDRVMREER